MALPDHAHNTELHQHLLQTKTLVVRMCRVFFFPCEVTPASLWTSYASAQFDGVAAKCLELFKQSSPTKRLEGFYLAMEACYSINRHTTLL
jgi:hypothetical protein